MSYNDNTVSLRPEPRLVVVDRDRGIAPGTCYGPVIHDYFIIECCVDGGGRMIINEKEFSVSVGQGYVLFPKDSITMIADPVSSRTCLWCAVDGGPVADALRQAGISSTSPYLPPSAFAEVKDCISDMLDMQSDADGGADMRRAAAIYRLCGALLRGSGAVDKNLWINKAIGIMEVKYPQDLTVAELARAVGLDRAYFSTLFKSVIGSSPYAYLTELRVRKARALLSGTDMAVSAVADAVGIAPQNFARIFRRVTGMTPSEYTAGAKQLH